MVESRKGRVKDGGFLEVTLPDSAMYDEKESNSHQRQRRQRRPT